MSNQAILSVRVSSAERELLQTAAENAHTSLSDFVRRRAIEAAEIDLTCRPAIVIPAEDWDRFEAWASQPGKPIPELTSLARRKPVWQD